MDISTITEEKRNELLEEHRSGIEEMSADVNDMAAKIGDDHTVIQKMRQVLGIFSSFTLEELYTMDTYKQEEHAKAIKSEGL